VSVSSDEAQANGESSNYTPMTADGRYIAFSSWASNLVPGDGSGQDTFVRDRQLGTTEEVSVGLGGVEANGESTMPDISADGRYVVFHSTASNLVTGDANGVADIFRRDLVADTTEIISVATDGTQGNDNAGFRPRISDDGRYVTFSSRASNLVPGDNPGGNDTFLRDTIGGTTERVNLDDGEAPVSPGYDGAVSASGRWVAFYTYGFGDPEDTDVNFDYDVYLRDRTDGTLTWISRPPGGIPNGTSSGPPEIHEEVVGGVAHPVVTFGSYASNLTSEPDANGASDVFQWDGSTDQVIRLSNDATGGNANGASYLQAARDPYVVFTSTASDLVPGDTNGQFDTFLLEGTSGSAERISVTSAGAQAGGPSDGGGGVSADGRLVSFRSSANNLVAGDTNASPDVFVRDRIGVPATGAGDAVTTTATDDNPQDARVDLSLDCGEGVFYPVAVGLEPSTITEGAMTFAYSFDPAVACTGGQVTALLTDGFSTATTPGEPVESDPGNRDPLPAIAQPTADTDLLAYDAIPLRGSAKDPEDGELPDGALSWTLDGADVGTGPVLDLQPPGGGWDPGNHTATLTATDSAGASTSASVSFTILGDADNDGVTTSLESGCAGTSDTDPTDGYADTDDDGIGNGDDVTTAGGPCTAATSYSAVVNVTPDFLDRDNDGGNPVQARITVPFQTAAAVVPSSVRISRIGGVDADITATSVTVSGDVATASFSRTEVNAFLRAQGPNAERVPFVVTGTGTGGWTFEGTDTVVTK
jgi:Tol biopolymer transport system component